MTRGYIYRHPCGKEHITDLPGLHIHERPFEVQCTNCEHIKDLGEPFGKSCRAILAGRNGDETGKSIQPLITGRGLFGNWK
jgi:hypothetical protein